MRREREILSDGRGMRGREGEREGERDLGKSRIAACLNRQSPKMRSVTAV